MTAKLLVLAGLGAIALLGGDFSIYQNVEGNKLVEVRRTDTAGIHFGNDFGTVKLSEDRAEQEVVGFVGNAILPGLSTEVHVDALEVGQKVMVGIGVDGSIEWRSVTSSGLLTTVRADKELTLVMIYQDGNSMVRRLPVLSMSEQTEKGTRMAVATSGPLSLRFLVQNGSRLCEVVPGSNLGGRFVTAPERTVFGHTTRCKTDRVQRGETVVTIALGSGPALSGIETPRGFFGGSRYLPFADFRTVIADPQFDNLVASVRQGSFHARLRVPIGRR